MAARQGPQQANKHSQVTVAARDLHTQPAVLRNLNGPRPPLRRSNPQPAPDFWACNQPSRSHVDANVVGDSEISLDRSSSPPFSQNTQSPAGVLFAVAAAKETHTMSSGTNGEAPPSGRVQRWTSVIQASCWSSEKASTSAERARHHALTPRRLSSRPTVCTPSTCRAAATLWLPAVLRQFWASDFSCEHCFLNVWA